MLKALWEHRRILRSLPQPVAALADLLPELKLRTAWTCWSAFVAFALSSSKRYVLVTRQKADAAHDLLHKAQLPVGPSNRSKQSERQ